MGTAARRGGYLLALTAASVAVATTIVGAIQGGEAVSAMSLLAKAGVASTLLTAVCVLFVICLAPLRRRSDRAPRLVQC